MSTTLVALIIILFSVAYIFVKRQFSYWSRRGFFQADASFPFGSIKGANFSITLTEKLDEIYKQFKGKASVVGFYNFLGASILPIDPEIIKHIFVKDFASFHDRGFFYNKRDDPLTNNILSIKGQEWKDRRAKFTPVFTSAKMKQMYEIIEEISDKFALKLGESLKDSNIQDMRIWARRFTNDNIGSTVFGIDAKCLEDINSDLMVFGQKSLNMTLAGAFKFAFGSTFPEIARFLRFKILDKDSHEFFLNTFLQTLEYRRNNKQIVRHDFVSMLLELSDQLPPIDLAAEATIMYLAGFETSATLISFALYELALNSEMQDRLRDEILNGINENDGKITYEMLYGFEYLDMVINETLRKLPSIPHIFRKCTKDFVVPNTNLVIPKGTQVIINNYSLQHDPEYFPNPEKFDPERFNSENKKKINPYTNMPFALGNRNCLGERFGLMQAKIGVVKMIKNFIFTPCNKTTIPMKFVPNQFFLTPVGGIQLCIKKIH